MLKRKTENVLKKGTSILKKGKSILNTKKGENILKVAALTIFMCGLGTSAFAAEGTQAIDSIITWIASWTLKIGLVVAFIGGIQVALGFKSDDANEKVRGLKTLAAGFMVAGISKSLDLFGL